VTDHRHWLELAAVRRAFPPEPIEAAELDAHLASCDSCSRETTGYRADLALLARLEVPAPSIHLRERVREAALTREAGGEGWTLATIVIVGLLAAALLGATLGVGAFLTQRADPITELDPNAPLVVPGILDKPIVWQTDVVRLGADSVTILANGTTYHAVSPPMKISSDPGDRTRWTLEVAWFEANLQQRLNLYFGADETTWWIDEIRVYDGVAPNPDWAKLPLGPYARTPLGQAFRGDVTLAGGGRAGPVQLTMTGVILAVAPRQIVNQPPGGAAPPKKDPVSPNGPILCTVPGKPVTPPPKIPPDCPPLPSG
jgi:hypothetical protein